MMNETGSRTEFWGTSSVMGGAQDLDVTNADTLKPVREDS